MIINTIFCWLAVFTFLFVIPSNFAAAQSIPGITVISQAGNGVSTVMEAAETKTRDLMEFSWNSILKILQYRIFDINETPITGFGILKLLGILFAAWWASKLLRRGLQRFGEKQVRVSKTSLYTVGRILHYLILTVGILIGLSSIGLDFTKLAIFASALGVGLGFGLQNIVSNFVSGLIILFEKSLNIGDFIELESGVTGEVREINMRSVLVTTNDNVDILVPNSEFVSTRVTNWTLREASRRMHVPFGVAYGTDKDLVRSAVLEAAANVPGVLKSSDRRQPQVWLVGFGESSLDFELVIWLSQEAVKRPQAVLAEFLWEIETVLKENDIEIPFPQRDLHLRSGFPPPKD
ncbi:MAG: mechanosensitive ion channel [Verrucomicrobiales bacterium]|nr:mechanosensitive ion channel [Verrucomicrobiales bacterium]